MCRAGPDEAVAASLNVRPFGRPVTGHCVTPPVSDEAAFAYRRWIPLPVTFSLSTLFLADHSDSDLRGQRSEDVFWRWGMVDLPKAFV